MQKLVDTKKLVNVRILSKSNLNDGFYFGTAHHITDGTIGDIIITYEEIVYLVRNSYPIYINSTNERLKYQNFNLYSYDITTSSQTNSFENLRYASYYEELYINEFLK
jgi:hypothetical protein